MLSKIKRKKLRVPMQVFALSYDIMTKNTEIAYTDFFYQISTFYQVTKN